MKQVVHFALKVVVDKASGGLPADASVVVEWKRGKHHGATNATVVGKDGVAVWESGGEIMVPCTMYYNPKKHVFEEKSLVLVLLRGKHSFGKATVSIDAFVARMEDQMEKTEVRKEHLDGVGQVVVLEYSVSMKRLQDPRDKSSASPMPLRSPAMPVAPRGGPASAAGAGVSAPPTPTIPVAASRVKGAAATAESTLSESPLQTIQPPALARKSSSMLLTTTVEAAKGDSGGGGGSTSNAASSAANSSGNISSASSNSASSSNNSNNVSSSNAAAAAAAAASSARGSHERNHSTSAIGNSPTKNHSRTPSGATAGGAAGSSGSSGGASIASVSSSGLLVPTSIGTSSSVTSVSSSTSAALQKSHEFDPMTLLGSSSGKASKKSILGGAGHRRGKSHAVTPDELRGLHAGASPLFPQAGTSASFSASGPPGRKSGTAKVVSKLGLGKRPERGSGSVSLIMSPRIEASSGGSDRSGGVERKGVGSNTNSGDQFLITGESSSSDFEEESPYLPGLSSRESGGASGGGGSSSGGGGIVVPSIMLRSSGILTSGESNSPQLVTSVGSNSTDHSEEVRFYKRELARRDQSFVLQHFLHYCEPQFARDLSLSAWVLFRCLIEWDGFSNDGKEFREQVLEGFEQKVSKTTTDLGMQLYWLSTLLSIMFLLRNKLKPIPRSDVQRVNALAVFQERLRGLATAMCLRSASLSVAELRPLVSPALLEHALLEDAAGPSSKNSRANHHQPVGPVTAKATLASIVAVLDSLLASLDSAHVLPSVAGQLVARVTHGVTAVALNTLLDNNPRLCTFSNGLQMKKPLAELRSWLTKRQFDAAAVALAPLEEVVNVLCMNKSALVDADVRKEVCPHLSRAQLGQLLLLYTPDSFDSEPIHPAILAALCDDIKPEDYKTDIELRTPLTLDLTEASYELNAHIDLPKSIKDQPSLAFLARPYIEEDGGDVKW